MDSILPDVYRRFNVPADAIATDPAAANRFATMVRERMPGQAVDTGVILKRLITLRKNGKLPRLRH
jgi:hypothetical protein